MKLARWRLYGLPGGWTTARLISGRRDPQPPFPRAVTLLDYRDYANACRSPRWSAVLDWALSVYDLVP